ncbi:hypothetical protein RRG08_058173 [Elysia crispata]|uniref:Uncharacterized protein n=1 Tax=Elysia crispata TaxID=231223 RepID=A0AAE0Y2R0_9GAST|nr:hypothetical protein RRG08_058173 [Elysia crispata]
MSAATFSEDSNHIAADLPQPNRPQIKNDGSTSSGSRVVGGIGINDSTGRGSASGPGNNSLPYCEVLQLCHAELSEHDQ